MGTHLYCNVSGNHTFLCIFGNLDGISAAWPMLSSLYINEEKHHINFVANIIFTLVYRPFASIFVKYLRINTTLYNLSDSTDGASRQLQYTPSPPQSDEMVQEYISHSACYSESDCSSVMPMYSIT